jgi:hypothetical protein
MFRTVTDIRHIQFFSDFTRYFHKIHWRKSQGWTYVFLLLIYNNSNESESGIPFVMSLLQVETVLQIKFCHVSCYFLGGSSNFQRRICSWNSAVYSFTVLSQYEEGLSYSKVLELWENLSVLWQYFTVIIEIILVKYVKTRVDQLKTETNQVA